MNLSEGSAWATIGATIGVAAFLSLACPGGKAQAAVTYTYQGNNYTSAFGVYDTGMNLVGTITTDFAAPPENLVEANITGNVTAFSFFDGVQTIDQSNSSYSRFLFSTDGLGNTTWWDIDIDGSSPLFAIETDTITNHDDRVVFGSFSNNASVTNDPGLWQVVVPVPAAAVLFVSALAGLGLIGVRRGQGV